MKPTPSDPPAPTVAAHQPLPGTVSIPITAELAGLTLHISPPSESSDPFGDDPFGFRAWLPAELAGLSLEELEARFGGRP